MILNDDEANIIEVDYEQDHKDVHTTEQLEMFDKVYNFFLQKLGMESYDNKDAIWKIFQHVGIKYNNAFWNGKAFAFGDADQVFFKTFWIQNVCTHEGMHAITEYVTQLRYQGQSGALNESISDVVAICLDHFLGIDHWIIGNGIWTDNVNGVGLRTFTLEPAFDDPIIGKDGQPKHMKDFYSGKEDHGGVHINSGILNHAFYLLCQKSGRKSFDAPLNIWWRAIQNTKMYDNFDTFAWNTLQVATGELKEHLEQAWHEVGITPKKPTSTLSFLTYFINLLLSLFKR